MPAPLVGVLLVCYVGIGIAYFSGRLNDALNDWRRAPGPKSSARRARTALRMIYLAPIAVIMWMPWWVLTGPGRATRTTLANLRADARSTSYEREFPP